MPKSHLNHKEKNTEDTMKNLKMQLRLASLSTLILLACTAAYSQRTPNTTHKPTITEFEVPGAGTGAYQGTGAYDINATGVMTGVYFDGNNVGHGFVGTLGGFTSFEAPGAGTGSGQGTGGVCINPNGVIAGAYRDANNVEHGFVRLSDGTITSFEAPGAGTGSGQGTQAENINPEGEIVGFFQDENNAYHGFLRTPGGSFTTLDAPGAGTGANQGTLAWGINQAGAIVGYYRDGNNVQHGFLLADGIFTPFEAPGGLDTVAFGVNPTGTIAGVYSDANDVLHGFVRATDGTITSFDAPGAGTGSGQGTITASEDGINPDGAIAGAYIDENNAYHGYVRLPDGTIAEFNAKGAGTGSG
jgi:probable HAF family extracellular repeat protein